MTENRKRYIQVLIRRARTAGEDDVTTFLNTDYGVDWTDEEMDYVVSIWDYLH